MRPRQVFGCLSLQLGLRLSEVAQREPQADEASDWPQVGNLWVELSSEVLGVESSQCLANCPLTVQMRVKGEAQKAALGLGKE